MIPFDEFSTKQVAALNKILKSASLPRRDLVRQSYLRHAQHFDSAVLLLEGLGCIELVGEKIAVCPWYQTFLGSAAEDGGLDLKRLLVRKLIDESNPFAGPINDFLSLFNGKRELRPTSAQRLKFSGVRNFLIDLEFLLLDITNNKYVIASEYFVDLNPPLRSRKISPEQLKRHLEEKEKIGKAAELEVIAYESKRLSGLPNLAGKIDHISESDSGAGFDIKSFENLAEEDGSYHERYIEVKAVSRFDFGFFLTRNELQKASDLRESYYLYLLPVSGNLRFDTGALRIIRDPYACVYQNPADWTQTTELSSFRLVGT